MRTDLKPKVVPPFAVLFIPVATVLAVRVLARVRPSCLSGTVAGGLYACTAAPALLASVAWWGAPNDRPISGVCANSASDEGPAHGSKGATLLVVDDAQHLCQAISAGLRSLGYSVVTAADGREALEAASAHDVDLVLTDLVMPRMDGHELLYELRAGYPGVSVVAMTGHVAATRMGELRAAGFDDALAKPFSMGELGNRLRAILDS